MVMQEWWGLVPQIQRVCDRLAAEGFVALAPDLYHGDIAEHTEMDKAGQLMATLPMDRAARDMGGAVDYLLAHAGRAGRQDRRASATAWAGCWRSLVDRAAGRQDRRRRRRTTAHRSATARPTGRGSPRRCGAISPATTTSSRPTRCNALEAQLKAMGKDVEFEVHPAPGTRSRTKTNVFGTYDADLSARLWASTVAFLHERLD